MNRFFSPLVVFLLLACVPAVAQNPLVSGRLYTVTLDAVMAPQLFNGELSYYIDVPSDAVSLEFTLSTSPREANIDMYARFGQDVQIATNRAITADFRSEEPLGEERIFISPATAPSLQAGRYFVALSAGFGNPQTFAFLRATVTLSSGPDLAPLVMSEFESGLEGWAWNYPVPDPFVDGSTLGSEDSVLTTSRDQGTTRYLKLESPPAGNDYFVAPPQFLGKLALLGPNTRIEFDLRFDGDDFPKQRVELRLLGNFTVFIWDAGAVPEDRFRHYIVPLEAGAFERVTGGASFEQVLNNTLRIEVRANYTDTGGVTSLDNFRLIGQAGIPVLPIVSEFEATDDGWRRNVPDAPPLNPRFFGVTTGDFRTSVQHPAAGGNPNGYLLVSDVNDLLQDFLVAPDIFLGDLSALGPDAAFEFDRRHASSSGAQRSMEVRIMGFGGAYRYLGPPVGREWTHYVVPLEESMWAHIDGPATFAQTLRAIQRIEVSVDEVPELTETNSLDNFQLRASILPGPQITAAPEELRFVSVEGEAPPLGQAVDLTSTGDPLDWVVAPLAGSPWVQVSAAEGSTPGTVVISVDPVGLGRGVFEGGVEVAWQGAARSLLIPVTLTIASPNAPLVEPGGVVNSANFRPNKEPGGELTGGMFVNIYGRRFAGATQRASSVPFPTELGDTSVDMGGLEAPIVFISPTELVAVVPQGLTQGQALSQSLNTAEVTVTRGQEISPAEKVRLVAVRPVLFSQNQQGTGLGAIQNVVSPGVVALNDFDHPAQPSQAVQIFATGLGRTEVAIPDGQAATGINRVTGEAKVSIGGMEEEPLYAGLSPGSPHLYQINAIVPANSPLGCSVPVRVTVDGVVSNEVTMAVTENGEPCR